MANSYDNSQYSITDQDMGSEDGALVSKQEKHKLTALASDAVKKSASAMGEAQLGKTEKFLGFNVDAGLAAYLSSIYNIASDMGGRFLIPRAYKLTTALGEKIGIAAGQPLERTAAVTTFALIAGLKSAADIGKLSSAISENKKTKRKLVREIAPVLDDIKGRHSLNALDRVSSHDNEVIWAHRQRLAKISKSHISNKLISMAVNVAPNLALDVTHFGHMWNGKTPSDIAEMVAKEKANAASSSDMGADDGSLKGFFRTMVQATSGQISDRVTKTNEYKLRNGMQPYSALEMILELQKQVESNPKATSFQTPKGFAGNKHPESYPLEEYLGLLFIQHQRDMADLRDDNTEIREALHEDLTAAVKPIAKAIRAGDLSVMSLVRLVGERQIIKNHGRAIAEPKEVDDLIRHSSAYVHTDLDEFWRNSTHTREEMKGLLKKLEGKDREIYLALLPDAVKKDIGVSDKEIKTLQGKPKEECHKLLAELTAAAHQQSGGTLKKDGLAKPEIKILDAAYEAVKRDGVNAIGEFKTSATNPKGIEQVLANWAVPHIQGGKDHLGTILEKGRAKVEAFAAETDKSDLNTAEDASFAGREKSRSESSRGAEMDY